MVYAEWCSVLFVKLDWESPICILPEVRYSRRESQAEALSWCYVEELGVVVGGWLYSCCEMVHCPLNGLLGERVLLELCGWVGCRAGGGGVPWRLLWRFTADSR